MEMMNVMYELATTKSALEMAETTIRKQRGKLLRKNILIAGLLWFGFTACRMLGESDEKLKKAEAKARNTEADGYQFEHEATYEKMCLVNNAVYIARYMDAADCKAWYGYVPGDNEKEGGEWTATGTQFQVPYVFKTLFSHEDIVFNDLCETKSVSKGAIYLDKNEDLAEGEHNYIFVGRVGQFCPIKPGCGGALLVREAGVKDNGEAKYDSVTGAKDYRWLESEMVYNLHLEETIDRSYFDKMATKAVEAISEYGDFEQFASNDLGEPPWQKPDIPWDDVQDEAAQNFDVR